MGDRGREQREREGAKRETGVVGGRGTHAGMLELRVKTPYRNTRTPTTDAGSSQAV